MENIIVYTDGSCSGKNGGWAFVSIEEAHEFHISDRCTNTTNNIMELTAVIEALKFHTHIKNFIVYSDSKYVINCATGLWKRSKNLSYWEEYDTVSKNKNIKYIWVKGHSGNKYNDLADKLAQKEMRSLTR